jgi:hypothetical protein
VFGTDGRLGSSIALLLDPGPWMLAALVVRNADIPGSGRLVPPRDIITAGADRVDLAIERRQLVRLPRFIVPCKWPPPDGDPPRPGAQRTGPPRYTFAVSEQVPPGLVAVDARLRAVDDGGHLVGSVARWRVDARSGRLLGISVRANRRVGGGVFFASEIIGDITTSYLHLRLQPAYALAHDHWQRFATSASRSGNDGQASWAETRQDPR